MRLVVVLFSAMDRVRFALPEPELDDSVIQSALSEAVQLAFEVMEMLFEVAAEVTDMLVGETVGATTLVPLCVTVISLLREPEVSPVSDTVTFPVRDEVLVLAEAFTEMVLPLVETVIQFASVEVVNVPSVVTVTVFVPPPVSKVRLSGETVKVLPSCVTLTIAYLPSAFEKVTLPVRCAAVVFSAMEIVTVCPDEPEAADNVIHASLAVAVHVSVVVITTDSAAAAAPTEIAVLSTLMELVASDPPLPGTVGSQPSSGLSLHAANRANDIKVRKRKSDFIKSIKI